MSIAFAGPLHRMANRFANPAQFMRATAPLLPWLYGASAVSIAIGLVLALVASPPDYQQGETVRIMYVHVPAATFAELAYACVAIASAISLVWRHPLAEVAAREAAPLGAGFTAVCLVTGSLWGAPMWGTWWVWDARLTSVLILFFLYLGYLALAYGFDDPRRGARASAILAIVGAVNLPIIKFSVDWWNTLHQPASLLRLGGPSIDPSILAPLLTMMAAEGLLFLTLWCVRIRMALMRAKIEAIECLAAERGMAERGMAEREMAERVTASRGVRTPGAATAGS